MVSNLTNKLSAPSPIHPPNAMVVSAPNLSRSRN